MDFPKTECELGKNFIRTYGQGCVCSYFVACIVTLPQLVVMMMSSRMIISEGGSADRVEWTTLQENFISLSDILKKIFNTIDIISVICTNTSSLKRKISWIRPAVQWIWGPNIWGFIWCSLRNKEINIWEETFNITYVIKIVILISKLHSFEIINFKLYYPTISHLRENLHFFLNINTQLQSVVSCCSRKMTQ